MTTHSVEAVQHGAASQDRISDIMLKLASVLRQENAELETGLHVENTDFVTPKNQVLRELISLQRNVDIRKLPADVLQLVRDTRQLVDRNHHLLKLQVSALNDVTSFLTKVAVDEQSDGTYSRDSL